MSEGLPRLPNPWIGIPVLAATVLGWFIGGAVGRVGCSGSCGPTELAFSLLGAAVGFAGTLVVAVLVVRSLAEWRALQNRNGEVSNAGLPDGEPSKGVDRTIEHRDAGTHPARPDHPEA